jgi:MFS-type transporter involved in bile tolerance (Atg22 family)
MIGLWTDKFGSDLSYYLLFPQNIDPFTLCRFHNAWEFWVYNALTGLVTGPSYSFTQTMMSELTPPGFEYMVSVAPLSITSESVIKAICSQKTNKRQFFGLLGLSSRSASVIGPNVVQAIIDKNGNNWKAFPVLFVIGALGCLVIAFGVNGPKGRYAAAQWAAEKRGMGAGTGVLYEKDRESSESKNGHKNDGKF